MTQNTKEYGVFNKNLLVSPILRTPAHAMDWAAKKNMCRAVGHGWTPLPEGHEVRAINSLDIDAIYKNRGCCGECLDHPCRVEKSMASMAALLAVVLNLTACANLSPTVQVAEAVNQQINSSITYQSDAEQYGQSDRWVVEPTSGKGDCEDYALTKAARLNAGGIPTAIFICLRDGKPAHAVAVAYDGKEEWVLDSLYPRAIRKADYDCKVWLNASGRTGATYHGK